MYFTHENYNIVRGNIIFLILLQPEMFWFITLKITFYFGFYQHLFDNFIFHEYLNMYLESP